MVLQRQVPARPAAKAGDGMSSGDFADGAKSDAFSAALSKENRSTGADLDKGMSKSEVDTENVGAEPDEQVTARPGQSDDILNLLAGLQSSATYPDGADLGASENGEDLASQLPEQTPEADAKVADAEVADEALALTIKTSSTEITTQPKTVDVAAAADAVARSAPNQVTADVTATRSVASAPAPDAKVVQTSIDAKAAAATPTAQVVQAAAASQVSQASQSAPAPQKTTGASAATDQQKDPSSLKEAIRALGLDGEAAPANADAGKTQARGRNAGKQNGADDKRIDDLAGKKDGKVEVIESRRFMPAQNLSANAQMLTRSLAEASSNALAAQRAAPLQALAQTGAPQAGQTLHTLKLQLNPVSLGSVTAVLKLSGDELSVEIKVQTAEAYRQIKDDNQSILKSLRGQGFGVEQITVQHVVGSDRASGQSAQQGFQTGQQGPGANDAQSFGRDGSGNNAGQQQSGSRGGQSHEQSSYAGSGAGRTDGVYL